MRMLAAFGRVIGLSLLCACQAAEPLPKLGALPELALRDQHDRPVTRATFAGKVVIADFIFTSCPDVCPLLTEQLASLRKQLPSDPALWYASFSVDPGHDTPPVLAAYAVQHAADQPNWLFLTGPVEHVKDVVTHGFKQAMDPQPAAAGKPYNVLHGTHFVLVDQHATLRGFYRTDPDGLSQLTAAVKTLLAEREP